MAKFRIMSKDGNTVKYEGKLRYIGTYLKPSYVEFPEVSSPFPIEWEMGDYVYYPRTDMYYRLFSIPQVTKQAKKNTDIIKGYESDGTPIYVNAYGDAFTYSNVQLHAATKELEIAPFRDLVAADNGIHFSTSPDVVTTENAYGIASRIQACMDDLYPGKWEIRVASLGADHEVDLTETRDFALSGGTCLDALSKIYELWQDIGWIHTYENGKDVITIGYANVRKENNTTTPYLYGKGNGLTAIKKNQTNKDEFATRLYVYGSDRNLPPRFYNQLSIANAESVDIRNLMIPVDKWGRTDGLPDARKAYIENTSAVEKYGVIPKTHYFDSLESGADIYPSIEGMTASQVRSALSAMGESDYYPSNIYSENERMDEVLVGDDVTDIGTANEAGKSYTKIIRVPFEDIYVDGVIPAESTTAVIGKHLLLNHTFDGPGKAKIEVKSEATGYVLDAGYKSVTLIVDLSDSITRNKTVSKRVELPLSKAENGDWNFTIPRSVIAKYDDEEFQSFPVYFEVSVSVEMESKTTEEISTEFVINSGRCDIEYTDILPKFFTMTLKQIGFDISDRAANGNGKVISMKTGACAGRSFVIEACEKDSKNDGWKLTCRRQQDNTLGMWFPNISYKVLSGDRFVLVDISMPDSYVYAAMQRLFDEGQKLLARASKVQSHYEPSIDAKLMAESGRVLREGMYMEITDEDMVDGKTDYILIDTLNIYEDESSIPTYKVSLRERRKVTYKGTPSASSSINGSSVDDETDEREANLEGYATEKYVDEKYGIFLDWFYQHDANTIGTRFNFVSEKQIASGGIGEESGESGESGGSETGGSAALENNVSADTTVGFISKNTTLYKGLTFTDFVELMFSQGVKTYEPSVSIDNVPSRPYEVGSEITLNVSASFQDGYFAGTDEGTTNAGCQPGAAVFTLDGQTVAMPHVFVADTAKTHTVRVSQPYGASTVKPVKGGEELTDSISAGNAEDSASFIVGYRAFWGYVTDAEAESMDSDAIRGLEHPDTIINPGQSTVTLLNGKYEIPGGQDIIIAVPSGYELGEVKDEDGDFSKAFKALPSVEVKCAGDATKTYKVYRFDNGTPYSMEVLSITIKKA